MDIQKVIDNAKIVFSIMQISAKTSIPYQKLDKNLKGISNTLTESEILKIGEVIDQNKCDLLTSLQSKRLNKSTN